MRRDKNTFKTDIRFQLPLNLPIPSQFNLNIIVDTLKLFANNQFGL